jgi:hypothetical protein
MSEKTPRKTCRPRFMDNPLNDAMRSKILPRRLPIFSFNSYPMTMPVSEALC